MNLVLRNPLFRLLRTYGWAVLLVSVSLAIALGGFYALTAAGAAVALLAGLAGGVLAMGAVGVRRSREGVEADRRDKGLLFVCPQCLTTGTPTRACSGCQRPLPVDMLITRGTVVGFCEECLAAVSPEKMAGATACCAACGHPVEGAWEQACTVVATLSEADFTAAGGLAGGQVQLDHGLRFVRSDRPDGSLFLFCLADLANSRASFPVHHALSSLSKIWVDDVDALAGTEALDRLAQRAGLAQEALSRVELHAAGARLEPVAERAFAARLRAPRLGVSLQEFMGGAGAAGPASPEVSEGEAGR